MRLWIIGNGFDLYHGLKTRYLDYKAFLCQKNTCKRKDEVHKEHPELLPLKVCPCCCCDLDKVEGQDCPVRKFNNLPREKDMTSEELWRDLEEACSIDFDRLMEFGKGYYTRDLDSRGDSPLVDNEHDTLDFAEVFMGDLFYEWFCTVEKSLSGSKDVLSKDLIVSEKDLFITFNYTRTLQRLYGISDRPENKHIFHLHGSLEEADKVVDDLRRKGQLYFGKEVHEILAFGSPDVTEEALNNAITSYRKEYIGDENKEILRRHGKNLIKFLNKDVVSRREKLRQFLEDKRDEVKLVDEVIVAGHSLGRIDAPYFECFVEELGCKKWRFLCYTDDDTKRASEFSRKNRLKARCVPWESITKSNSQRV